MLKRRIARVAIPACAAILLGGGLTSCSDDLLTGQPSWLGESIYEELESRGNFTETLKLINAQDEDYASVLKKTGSKTLFVADDAAWQEFYKNNAWGVTSIESMTDAQKKLLFKANMINSAYLVELLGNLPAASANDDPQEGGCIRRATSVGLMDSVPVIPNTRFPEVNIMRRNSTDGSQIDYWARVRDKDSIVMLQDDNVATMIHFMPKFMQSVNITNDDVAFLTNGEITSNEGAFVNGKVITEKDITCQNGYIQVLEGVATPLDNMANVIANQPQFSIYNRLLDRFSYPHYDATVTAEYQRQYGGEDSVYVKRYFNSHGSHSFTRMDDNTAVSSQLAYDPGWNLYTVFSGSGLTYQQDAAAMLVPTDEAMMKFLETDGSDINERYAKAGPGATAWDNAPDNVVLPLLNNTMLVSLKASIPSQFASITNTASEPMGVEKADIDQVLWGCNGIIYQTNKVYVAPEYVSVYYPCVIRGDDDLHYLYFYLEQDASATEGSGNNTVSIGKGYRSHLLNQGTKYSFIIPTNKALQTYFDPATYSRVDARGNSTAVAYSFYVSDGTMMAIPYTVDWTNLNAKGQGAITGLSSIGLTTGFKNGDVTNHLSDIVSSSFTPSLFVPGQKFYQAQNGGPIIVEWNGNTVTGVAGSFQYERGYFVPVTETFDKSADGNGRSYIVEDEPLMSTFTSPYTALTDSLRAEQFGSFANLLSGMNIVANASSGYATMDHCLTNLNSYHYTIYVPTNASVDALQEAHQLPTWDDIDAVQNAVQVAKDRIDDARNAGDDALAEEIAADTLYLATQIEKMESVINNFVLYHFQDNSVYVEGESHSNDVFESACLDTLTNRFVKLYVSYELGGDMTITDNAGNRRTVDRECNNILTRQYYFWNNSGSKTTDKTAISQIASSSFVVLHQIDAPLQPSANCYYDPEAYDKVQEVIARYPVEVDITPNPIKRKR